MKRRGFIGAILALPFLRRFVPSPPPEPVWLWSSESATVTWTMSGSMGPLKEVVNGPLTVHHLRRNPDGSWSSYVPEA